MKNLVLFMFSAQIFLVHLFANDCPKKDVLLQMYTYGDSCIIEVEEDRYYLDPEKIYVTQEGICLLGENSVLPLSNLLVDNKGMYTVGMYYKYICNNCGKHYNSRPRECSRCGSTSFSFVDHNGD